MAKIGIYYGSDTGNTQTVAQDLAKALDVSTENVFDVSKAGADFSVYDVLLFGSSTMGYGDLQDDWDAFLDKVKSVDLSGKKVAIFGCGDSASYSDTFCDAVGKIYEVVRAQGAEVIGHTSTEGYTFDSSEALVDGQFVGLLIDEDNESDQTAGRIAAWVDDLKKKI
ncbi:flavodoxin [Dysgonomonas sp. 520]|uniref:flavodoxin n=1 Tax=Dysgonomonas sp. 520 TaxID=2302931 RepID=UPI0013D39BEF|nr:flavodoxin [Dysgonomonas sp. 520]NDW09021.1 flavodoxin [Dysgonomonas sp. 520]